MQRVLDLARADLVAAALDQVGRAPARRSGCSRPRRAWPRRRSRTSRRGNASAVASGPVEVLEEEVRPADLDLAHGLVVPDVELVAGVVDEPHRHAVQRHARPSPAGARRRRGSPCSSASRSSRSARRAAARTRPRSARGRRPAARPSRDTSSRAPADRGRQRRGRLEVRREPVVHRRHAEQHRRAPGQRRARGLGGEAPEMPGARRRAAAARARRGSARARGTAAARARRRRRPSTPRRRRARRGSTRSRAAAAATPFGGPVVPDV